MPEVRSFRDLLSPVSMSEIQAFLEEEEEEEEVEEVYAVNSRTVRTFGIEERTSP